MITPPPHPTPQPRSAKRRPWLIWLAPVAACGLGTILVGSFLKGCQSEHSRAHHVAMAGYDVSPDGNWVVFAAKGGGGRDLFLLNLETRALRALTNTRDYESGPAFSRDGKRVAFARGVLGVRADQLCVMDIGTGAIEQITEADENIVSPVFLDDRRVICVVEREYRWGGLASSWGGDGELRIIDIETRTQSRFPTPSVPVNSPRVSQDGEWVVWTGMGAVYRSGVADSAGAKRVASDGAGVGVSPDGASIAVSQGRYSPDHKIYLVGGGQRTLISGSYPGCFQPRFSGEFLYFTSEVWQGGSYPDTSLMRARLSDGKVELVAPASLFWDPLGKG